MEELENKAKQELEESMSDVEFIKSNVIDYSDF